MFMKNIIRFYTMTEHSDNFEIYHYPDGQKNIRLDLSKLDKKKTVGIICSIRNFQELEILLCLDAALIKNDFCIDNIEFSYLFGIRCDRAFKEGEPNYFRDVLHPIIDNLRCRHLYLHWYFRPLSLNINNRKPISYCPDVISTFLSSLKVKGYSMAAGDETCFSHNYLAVAPTIFFRKERLTNGELKVTLEDDKMPIRNMDQLKILITDDLCDGGKTFIEEAKYLKKLNEKVKLKLFVFHGLFTNGLDCLLEYFDEIICTNSYQKIDHPRVKQIKVI